MQAYDRLTAAFPSEGASDVVVVRAAPEQAATVRAALLDLSGRAAVDPLFAPGRQPEVDVSADGRVSQLSRVTSATAPSRPAASRRCGVLRTRLVPDTVGRVPGAEVAVTGDTAALGRLLQAAVRTGCRWWSGSCWR